MKCFMETGSMHPAQPKNSASPCQRARVLSGLSVARPGYSVVVARGILISLPL